MSAVHMFYAESIRPVFIQIPAEDRREEDEGMVGRLNLSLYGTRDAAQHWSVEYTRTLRVAGFEPGKASPCNFVHRTRDLALTVHGDDFTASGPIEDLVWLESVFRKRYDIKATVLGPDTHQAQEVKILGRTLRWTEGGLSMRLATGTTRLSLRRWV